MRLACHNDALFSVWEARTYAVPFLLEAAQRLPALAEPLQSAACHYEGVMGFFWRINESLGGFAPDPKRAQRLAQPEIRASLARLILQARHEEAQAVIDLERALLVQQGA